jgi:hypothetical protein
VKEVGGVKREGHVWSVTAAAYKRDMLPNSA